jgi:hypothetical protein
MRFIAATEKVLEGLLKSEGVLSSELESMLKFWWPARRIGQRWRAT